MVISYAFRQIAYEQLVLIRCCGEGINVFKGDEKITDCGDAAKQLWNPVMLSHYKSALWHEYGNWEILALGSRRDLYKVFRCGPLTGLAVVRMWNAIIPILVLTNKKSASCFGSLHFLFAEVLFLPGNADDKLGSFSFLAMG